MVQEDTVIIDIPLYRWVRPNYGYGNISTADGTYMGLVGNTVGTNAAYLNGSPSNNNTRTETIRCFYSLPECWVPGESIYFRFHAHTGVVLNVSASLDLNAYKMDGDKTIGSDLVLTVAQDCNQTAFQIETFEVDGSGLVVGDCLDLLLTASGDDTGGSANGRIEVGKTEALLDIKG